MDKLRAKFTIFKSPRRSTAPRFITQTPESPLSRKRKRKRVDSKDKGEDPFLSISPLFTPRKLSFTS